MNDDNRASAAALDTQPTDVKAYNPKKPERAARRKVYERFYDIQGDGLRTDAELDWEEGDRQFGHEMPDPVAGDWRANLILPDAFAGIQAQMQETVDRNSRPFLRRVEDSDKGIELFQNAVLTYNLNRTGFDFQFFLAKYSAAIRGTAYLVEKYRVDKREIQDPTGTNPDGTLKYVKKEITDFDDTYTEWIPNEFVFIDPNAKHIDEAVDCIIREVVDVDEFKRAHKFHKDWINIDLVQKGGDTSTKSFFKMPQDLNSNQVEVLHYYNRSEDQYYVVANNVVVRMGPIPFKHKELPVTPIFHYMVPGRMYGLGIPKVIQALTQERASIRNLNLDRQKMQINKMFLVNDQVDFDEEEAVTRPHGMVEISTNGTPLRDAIIPLEYGDVPGSAFKSEEILLEDIRRATGIDDRIQGIDSGGTATSASILKESSQKRINLIAKISEMDSVKRIGRLKWSNIQFFYPAPRIERITEENDEREKKVYKKVQVDGQEFELQKDAGSGKTSIKVNEVEGSTTFKLDPSHARFLEGDYDVTIDSESITVVSKALQQAKVTEMFTGMAAIPQFLAEIDPRKAVARITEVNQENPKDWMRGNAKTDEEQMELAEWENQVMLAGNILSPTEGANEMHTLRHLDFTNSVAFSQADEAIKAIFQRHILGEHEANPSTGSVGELPGAQGAPGQGGPQGPPPPEGLTPPAIGPPGSAPSIQPADITPSTVTGEQPNTVTSNGPLLR